MEQLSTKERIIKEALNLFAKKGYDAVSVAQIAHAVGMKAPSLYKHFKNKQDIFDSILAKMEERYEQQMVSMQMNGTEPGQDMELFLTIREEQLIDMGKNLFLYFLQDEYASKFRRMLTMEQYHNKTLASLYAKQYVNAPLLYQEMIMGLLMKSGVFIPVNSRIAALHFYAPMCLLLNLCDCHPEKETEVLQMAEQHIRQFNLLYRRKE